MKRGVKMSTAEVRFAVPSELVQSIKTLSHYGYQSFVLNLYLDEEISFGRAAKLLGKTYDEFLDFLGQRQIPYFRDTAGEIVESLEKLKSI